MNFLRSIGRWLARVTDVASRLLYEVLAVPSEDGKTGFDVFGRRIAAVAVWTVGAIFVTSPIFSTNLAMPLGDVLFRTGTGMWAG